MLVDIDRSILPHFDLIGGKYKLFVHSFIYLSMKICYSVFRDASKKKMLKNDCTISKIIVQPKCFNIHSILVILSNYRSTTLRK